jgi:DNA polymerase alpha subunit A
VDVEWYLTQQILPPIARLCEPIEGTSLAILAERLGLDKSRFAHGGSGGAGFLGGDEGEAWGFTPACKMEDSERFAACEPLRLRCTKCKVRAGVQMRVSVGRLLVHHCLSVVGGVGEVDGWMDGWIRG